MHLHKFTNHYTPWKNCYTTFYENTVQTTLIRLDGTQAPILKWDLTKDFKFPIGGDNEIVIVHITKIPKNEKELYRFLHTLQYAQQLNIRLIVPRHHYNAIIRMNIDNDYCV